MARLNEPPVSTDSLETLRKKLLRQNRDLAKSNNVRALRIRELENECACMLSENLELRGRILELEKEVEDNDARRIADHALAIKSKLESQLLEWGTLLAGLGLEPPMKRHSPRIRRSTKPRLSFSSTRPSPSQRRLRDIARDIEELGSISENKSYPRRSMNPEQILALRSEVDSVDSPELGPPPMSQFIDSDPVKVDSPSQLRSASVAEPNSPKPTLNAPEALTSSQSEELVSKSPSPKKQEPDVKVEPQPPTTNKVVLPEKTTVPILPPQPVKTGSKRKLAVRDDIENIKPRVVTNENAPPRLLADKQSIREKAGGRTLKELASMRKEAREKAAIATSDRKPLAAKSTNNDVGSPKKSSKPTVVDDIAAAKAALLRPKASQDRAKSKQRTPTPITIDAVTDPRPDPSAITVVPCELGTPLNEVVLLSPSSSEPETINDGSRGATPPPSDVSSTREPARLSRRNRTAVSYAEPNLRDKMRRPTKELFDAVTGEGKYARRSSQADPAVLDSVKVKPEADTDDAWKSLPLAKTGSIEDATNGAPASPLALKGPPENLPSSVVTDRRRRVSVLAKESSTTDDKHSSEMDHPKDEAVIPDSSDADIYEFHTSSPQQEKQEVKRKPGPRKGSRRMSAALQNEQSLPIRDRVSSRRRSMMI